MKNITTTLALVACFTAFSQVKQTLKSNNQTFQKSEKTKGASTGSKIEFPELDTFTLEIETGFPTGVSQNYFSFAFMDGQASTTNTSFFNLRAGFGREQISGLSFYGGVYLYVGDGLSPWTAFYEDKSQIGSVFKSQRENGFEFDASYLFGIGQSSKTKTKTAVSITKGNITYNYNMKVPVTSKYMVGPAVSFERGFREYSISENIGGVWNVYDKRTQTTITSAGYFTSGTQNYTNVRIGARFRIAEYIKLTAGKYGSMTSADVHSFDIQYVHGIRNTFDDVYRADLIDGTLNSDPTYTDGYYAIHEGEIDAHNEKYNGGFYLGYNRWDGGPVTFSVFGRMNPGFKANRSLDLGLKVAIRIGKSKYADGTEF